MRSRARATTGSGCAACARRGPSGRRRSPSSTSSSCARPVSKSTDAGGALPHLRGDDFEDLAQQSANDALLALLGKLEQFRGESRFTTWAYKFALLEAGVKVRRRAWQGREIPLEAEGWATLADAGPPAERAAEDGELFAAIRAEIEDSLSPRQREVLVAVALNGVPIDVLAERLDSTRGALYKTLHDARRKLRAAIGGER